MWPFRRRQPQPPTDDRRRVRRFAGAVSDRLTASWLSTERSINDELRSDLDALRARCRDLSRNHPLVKRYLRLVQRNIIGPAGPILQCRVRRVDGEPDAEANSAIEAAWWEWCQSADAAGTSFATLCRSVISAVARDGEALVRLVGGAKGTPLRLQHLDVARLDTRRNQGKDPVISLGVEIGEDGAPTAYWLRDSLTSGGSTRHSADSLLHLYLPEYPEQSRGIPWLHAVLLDLHDLGEFRRSALLSARRSADVLGFLVAPGGDPSAVADEQGVEEAPIKISAPGTYDVLPEGYDIRTPEFAYPNSVYAPFTKAMLLQIAAGCDVSHVSLTGDLEAVNYSSLRAGALDERDQWMVLQDWLTSAFLRPVYMRWLRVALLRGIRLPSGRELSAADLPRLSAHDWQTRRWPWVDPLKDIEAARLAVQSGITSPQAVAAQHGQDVEDVIDAIAAFESLLEARGIKMVNYGAPSPGGVGNAGPDRAE